MKLVTKSIFFMNCLIYHQVSDFSYYKVIIKARIHTLPKTIINQNSLFSYNDAFHLHKTQFSFLRLKLFRNSSKQVPNAREPITEKQVCRVLRICLSVLAEGFDSLITVLSNYQGGLHDHDCLFYSKKHCF